MLKRKSNIVVAIQMYYSTLEGGGKLTTISCMQSLYTDLLRDSMKVRIELC